MRKKVADVSGRNNSRSGGHLRHPDRRVDPAPGLVGRSSPRPSTLQQPTGEGRVPRWRRRPGSRRGSGRRRSPTRSPTLTPHFPHDADYLAALVKDFTRWSDGGFGVPDFLDSLVAFHPEQHRVDGLRHLVVFPMYTQNGSPEPAGRGRAARGDLAGLHRRPRGRRLLQQAVRADPLPGLHPRLRHQLRGAVPGDRCHARDPEVHLGRDLRRPGGRPVPPGGHRGRRHHRAGPAAGRRAAARRPGTGRAHLRDVGPDPRPHPHARRPAVRPVHDQAADAVLPVLARGAALRPDRVPRVGEAARRPANRTPGWSSTR